MYILKRQTSANNDPRHVVVYQIYNLQLVEVGNPEWINWEIGNPEIFPTELADQGINYLRPESKGYRNTVTGEMTPTKGTDTAPENYEKVVRPWNADEARKVANFSKIILRRRIEELYRQRVAQLNNSAIEFEMGTWDQQRQEAALGTGPLIEAIAAHRKIPLDQLIAKINAKAETYSQDLGNLIGEMQYYTDKMMAATTIREVALYAEDWFGIPRHTTFGQASKNDFQVHI